MKRKRRRNASHVHIVYYTMARIDIIMTSNDVQLLTSHLYNEPVISKYRNRGGKTS